MENCLPILHVIHVIPIRNIIVIQRAQGGFAPHLQLEFGPEFITEMTCRRDVIDDNVSARVAFERADAVA